ncbi:MAG: hypothetical protein GWM98_17915, partial [Nitrospinaceae bacterium]|nr:hypothetical protein [Nitrospinaceae bacterium]NIR56025.1 hypothetical protein [Nitrospinaceae bacterium]NIS86469.1 hypothetical protein [Nitrospinaceae bacterium]NIT83304.1 hypothetical protein [Nitrospinaceae bacterium]NIU45514.1 hypothetical protein [Nitrospinaceae bacterium]
MQATSLSELFFQPSFLFILVTILIVVFNILVGVSMLPADIRQKRYKLHRYISWAASAALAGFLVFHYRIAGHSLFNYLVFLYFLILIPLSRKWNVTLHAIVASTGLAMLVGVAAF